MEGIRGKVVGEDGVSIGLLTAGSGPALLLVHGGMGRLESWAPVWSKLAEHRQVTAMDRRGRGTSGDTVAYSLSKEFADIVAVATHIAARQSAPVDVFAHSFGATCTLGAAARGAPFRRLALYEPPGPQTVPAEWVERVCALVAEGKSGRAMFSFVTEIVGLSPEQFEGYRNLPGAEGVLAIVAATMPRERERSPASTWANSPKPWRFRCSCSSARRARAGPPRSPVPSRQRWPTPKSRFLQAKGTTPSTQLQTSSSKSWCVFSTAPGRPWLAANRALPLRSGTDRAAVARCPG